MKLQLTLEDYKHGFGEDRSPVMWACLGHFRKDCRSHISEGDILLEVFEGENTIYDVYPKKLMSDIDARAFCLYIDEVEPSVRFGEDEDCDAFLDRMDELELKLAHQMVKEFGTPEFTLVKREEV